MPLTPQDVREKLFSSARGLRSKGYDEDEVDNFLDEVEAELTRLNAEIEGLRAQLAGAPPPRAVPGSPAAEAGDTTTLPAAVPGPGSTPQTTSVPAFSAPPSETEEMLRRTLLIAQRTADDVVAQARADAERMVHDAQERAVAMERMASERQAAVMGDLDAERRRLEVQVDQLRSFEREYRKRLKAYLEMQLRELEGGPAAPAGGGPADAAPPPRPSVAASPSLGTMPRAPGLSPFASMAAGSLATPASSASSVAGGNPDEPGSSSPGAPAEGRPPVEEPD